MKKINISEKVGHFRLAMLVPFFICLLMLASILSCKKNPFHPVPGEEVDSLAIYIPQEFQQMDFNDSTSTWCYPRSRQSEHFIVFWGANYGDKDPNSTDIPAKYRVNIDDLLTKAESFYDLNINVLKFAERGKGKSNLDKYKMMIFLYYQDEWLATGSGYDDVIGALWISPGTSQPVGSTIAHEIGHSFQYQVHCDLGGGSGFRYGFGGNGGNGFWEQTAQWQAYQSYPLEAFSSHNFTVYTQNYHRHIHHEWQRYASYFIHYYWTNKHGIDIIGRIWREAQQPEDPIQAYMRITGISNAQLNDELYDAAAKFATWDLDALRENGKNYIGAHSFNFNELADGSFQVAYDHCPGTSGYNIIPLKVPAAGTQISTAFTGLPNATGYNTVDASRAGWRYGYVALLANGARVYGNMEQGIHKTVNFTIPENCAKLWFVVTGAPSTYTVHPWDEDENNDEQWPYKVKFTNTTLINHIDLEEGATPKDTTFTYDVSFPRDTVNYTGKTVTVDITQLAQTFVLQPGKITQLMGSNVKFYAVEPDGNLNATTTANGYGHWFDANGNVINWGSNAKVFSEFNATNFAFSIGQYPGHSISGNQYTVKQALVYEYEPGKTAQATFVFKINIE
ncbi:DUF4859 domain-containing protein [Olivibacter sp. CPCC 100613]|uniref:DUF4859 domain-containing protein n=1 Tax=Olivibacter sp. CPCC 100613 TaxID=3079931 RepID=UPI002FF6DED1